MVMRYKFQHYLDIETSSSSLNIIKIMAGGEYVRKRCRHLFGTYKYWKLGKIQVKLIPASTLPVDPLGLSMDDSDPYTVDPRDQMNPGLVRITNGEDTYSNFPTLEQGWQDGMYKSTMLDPRWSKFMLQSGFKRTAYPLYWQVGQLHQDVYPGATINVANTRADSKFDDVSVEGTFSTEHIMSSDGSIHDINQPFSSYKGFFQTGHRGKLGWLPTDAYEIFPAFKDEEGKQTVVFGGVPMLEPIPEIECITMILPRANKTKFYYRMFITEEVLFKGIKNVGLESIDGTTSEAYEVRAIDNFNYVPYPEPQKPGYPAFIGIPNPNPINDGTGGQKP